MNKNLPCLRFEFVLLGYVLGFEIFKNEDGSFMNIRKKWIKMLMENKKNGKVGREGSQNDHQILIYSLGKIYIYFMIYTLLFINTYIIDAES